MRNLFNRQLNMLLRVSAFGQKYANLFPPDSLAGGLFATIGSSLPDLTAHAGSQSAGVARVREGVAEKDRSRAALIARMDDIGVTARAMACEDEKLRTTFLVPHSASDQNLVSAARGFAQNAEAIKDLFIAHEMHPSFIDDLKTAITQFEAAIAVFNEAKAAKAKASAALEEVVDRVMNAAKRLDGIVPNKLRNDYPTLREWQSARKVARARGTAKPTDAEDSTSAPPAPEVAPQSATDPPAAVNQP